MKKTNLFLAIIAFNLSLISLNYFGIWPSKTYANTNYTSGITDVNIKTIDGWTPLMYPNIAENEEYNIKTAWLGISNISNSFFIVNLLF